MKRMIPLLAIFALGLGLGGAPVTAQSPPPDGGLPLELSEIFASEDLQVEINLGRFLLGMVASATEKEDSEFSELLRGLHSIKVRIASPEAIHDRGLLQRLRRAADRLDGRGWQPVVRIRSGENQEDVYIYVQEAAGQITGLVVMFAQGNGEAGLVHIEGEIDPEELGRLGQKLDLPLPEGLGQTRGSAPVPR